MRTNFVKSFLEEARKNKDIFLITGDLGFMALEPFRDELPGQYLNAGVSEQNMTGMAAGLALSGKTVFIYSIIPFVTMRNFEHIRNDIAGHNLDVKIVGVGAGYSYSIFGMSHHAMEDIAIMKILPNMRVVAPGDPWEVRQAVKTLVSSKGPIYLRLGRNGERELHDGSKKFELGKGIIMQEGEDATLIATSTMLEQAIVVAKNLEQRNVSVRLISMHTIKPLDAELILHSAQKTHAIFTLEEHYLTGGLGSSVAEVLAESSRHVIFKRFAVPDYFVKVVGSQKYLRDLAGLSQEKVTAKILELLGKK